MDRAIFYITVSAAAIALSGCGSSSSSFSADRARSVTDAEAPAMTAAEIQEQARKVIENENTGLGVSRQHLRPGENPPVGILDPTCSGAGADASCSFAGGAPRDANQITLERIGGVVASEDLQAVLTRNGVTTFEVDTELEGSNDVRAYGAWLYHGGFGVVTERTADIGGVRRSGMYSLAGGYSDAEEPAPDVDTTYAGLMVGSPVAGEHRGNILQGDADLVYTSADNHIDADFTDIRDLDRGVAYETETIRFADVPVDDDGIFSQRSGEDEPFRDIVGGFAGPGHEEVLGHFESDGVVGAFGAIREQPEPAASGS